ncbi:MAG: hypothetical protein HQK76_20000 [Desulfobacterales bacterium]|nr:hypothetical protein [Desulfobacterales bacterium]
MLSAIEAFRQEGIIIGEVKGKKEGRQEGAYIKAINTAKNLLSMVILTTEQIANATGLTVDEVEKIKHGKIDIPQFSL